MRPGEDETRSWRMADPNEVLPGPGRESSGDRPQTASDPQATRISSVRAVIPLGPVSEEKVRKSTRGTEHLQEQQPREYERAYEPPQLAQGRLGEAAQWSQTRRRLPGLNPDPGW